MLDDSTDETQAICRAKVERARGDSGLDISYIHRTDRTGFKAGALEHGLKTAQGRVRRGVRRRLRAARRTSSSARCHFFTDDEGRHGAGALGPPQPRLLAPHRAAGDHARRPLRHRAHRAQPLGPLLQLQRHRRHLAPHAPSTTRAAGSTTRSPRTWTSRTARSSRAGSSSILQDVVSPAELPVEMNAFKSQQYRWAKGSIQTAQEAAADDLAQQGPAVQRQARGVLPPHQQLRLSADCCCCRSCCLPNLLVRTHHGLARGAAHRPAAVLRHDAVDRAASTSRRSARFSATGSRRCAACRS